MLVWDLAFFWVFVFCVSRSRGWFAQPGSWPLGVTWSSVWNDNGLLKCIYIYDDGPGSGFPDAINSRWQL